MSLRLLAIAAGGALGALARYGLTTGIQSSRWATSSRLGSSLPWGTLAVNLLGCLLIGLLAGLFHRRGIASAEVRGFLLIGFLGGFTTFSTFALESLALLRGGNYGFALLNTFGSPALGLLGVWIGDRFSQSL